RVLAGDVHPRGHAGVEHQRLGDRGRAGRALHLRAGPHRPGPPVPGALRSDQPHRRTAGTLGPRVSRYAIAAPRGGDFVRASAPGTTPHTTPARTPASARLRTATRP